MTVHVYVLLRNKKHCMKILHYTCTCKCILLQHTIMMLKNTINFPDNQFHKPVSVCLKQVC